MADKNNKNPEEEQKIIDDTLKEMYLEADMYILKFCTEFYREKNQPKEVIDNLETHFKDYQNLADKIGSSEAMLELESANLFAQFRNWYITELKKMPHPTKYQLDLMKKDIEKRIKKKIEGIEYC